MELRQLAYFRAVAIFGGFTAAADELDISQPGLSAATKRLENELGVQLFTRAHGNIKLTAPGEVLLRHTEKISTTVQVAIEETKAAADSIPTVINLGLPPMVGAPLLPQLLHHFTTNPAVDLRIQELGTLEIYEQFQRNELDLGLVVLGGTNPVDDKFKQARVVWQGEIEILLMLPSAHRFIKRDAIPVADLSSEPIILMVKSTRTRDHILKALIDQGVTPWVRHTSSQIDSVRRLVAGGLGVAFVPKTIVPSFLGLEFRPLDPPLNIPVALIRQDRKSPSVWEEQILTFIHENYRGANWFGAPSN